MAYEPIQSACSGRITADNTLAPSQEAARPPITFGGKPLENLTEEEFNRLIESSSEEEDKEKPFQEYEDKAYFRAIAGERVRALMICNLRYHKREHIRKISPKSVYGEQKPYQKPGNGYAKNPLMRKTIKAQLKPHTVVKDISKL